MKKLSEKKQFSNSLILNWEYSSNPFMNGETELAVLFLKSKIQIWSWTEDYSESIAEFPIKASWRDIVDYALNDETFVSSVSLGHIEFLNDIPPFGQMLGFAVTESDEDKSCARLLLKLSDDDLLRLEKCTGSLYDDSLLSFLTNLLVKLDDEGIDIDDIPTPMLKKNFNYEDLESAFQLSIESAIKAQEDIQKQIELEKAETAIKLKPFDSQITLFVNSWKAKHTMSRYPGTSSTCYMRLGRAMAYITNHIVQNNEFPSGKHLIPAGQDCFGTKGPEYELDFEAYKNQNG